MRDELSSVGALFMQKLRDSEFLNAIKHRSTIPGGTCEFDLPDYTHWLNQPDEVRGADFAHWLAVIRPLGDAISELLWMTREQAKSRREVAQNGVFHLTLDRDVPVQLIRIALPAGTDIYPEISGSHYRVSVRFLAWQDANTHPVQMTTDVPFMLVALHLSGRRSSHFPSASPVRLCHPGQRWGRISAMPTFNCPTCQQARRVVGRRPVAPVLQRALPADRPRRLDERAALDPGPGGGRTARATAGPDEPLAADDSRRH